MNPRRLTLAAVLAVALPGVAACGGVSEAGGGGGAELSLVAYSTPQEAYEEIIPAFRRSAGGSGASFRQSYGASGEQARAVISGLPADVVALSLEPDVTKLVDEGLVGKDWKAGPHEGIVTNSVVVLAVREGNPKRIRTWDDLLRDDVEVVAPNPVTSGGARWNVMAAYGAKRTTGSSHAQALEFVQRVLGNVSVQDKSARESLQTFTAGKGDVLIAYENEAITARQKGQDLDYVIPDDTILIENPIAVTTRSTERRAAKAFVDFARGPRAQRIFASKGYRSILPAVLDEQDFPRPRNLFTIADLGGWERVSKRFFDAEDGLVTRINERLGVGAAG